MNNQVTLTIDVPEELHYSLSSFLEKHSAWDYNEVCAIALARFLRDEQGLGSVKAISARKLCLPVLS
jgi:hypothetical protein